MIGHSLWRSIVILGDHPTRGWFSIGTFTLICVIDCGTRMSTTRWAYRGEVYFGSKQFSLLVTSLLWLKSYFSSVFILFWIKSCPSAISSGFDRFWLVDNRNEDDWEDDCDDDCDDGPGPRWSGREFSQCFFISAILAGCSWSKVVITTVRCTMT